MNLVIAIFITIFLAVGAGADNSTFIPEDLNSKLSLRSPTDRSHYTSRQALSTSPVEPRRDDIIGERFVAGDTWYDFQTNGSLGKMIAVDPDGNVHITWMDGSDDNLLGGDRHQKYNVYFPDDEEWLVDGGQEIDPGGERNGYGSMLLTTEDDPRALIFYHGRFEDDWRGMCAIDFLPALGAFEKVELPRFVDQIAYFAQGAMTQEGLIHVALQRRDRGMISYTLGELDEDGIPAFGDLVEVGGTHRTSLRIARSPTSDRVAITWLYPRAGIPQPEEWATGGYAQNNDLLLVWSNDGEEWNFDDPLNITSVIPPDPDLEGDAAYRDTLRPYSSFDIIFDSDDYIHVVFDARGMWEQAIPVDEPPIDGRTYDASYLFHWSEETEEITPVADGWYSHREEDEDGELIRWPTPGGWQSNVCSPSLAFDEDGDLYCVFNYYPLEDYSLQDYCNGDIAVTVSEDNGETWYMPTMITETATHLAEVGESESEIYPTLAEIVDEYLHISYELDNEPGTFITDYTEREEIPTLCPWFYHRVPVDMVEREEIWENGPSWHVQPPESVEKNRVPLPTHLKVSPTFPNPFNSETTVQFATSRETTVQIDVYDSTGRLVSTVFSGKVQAGKHRVNINASSLTTGVYILQLRSESASISQKLVVMR